MISHISRIVYLLLCLIRLSLSLTISWFLYQCKTNKRISNNGKEEDKRTWQQSVVYNIISEFLIKSNSFCRRRWPNYVVWQSPSSRPIDNYTQLYTNAHMSKWTEALFICEDCCWFTFRFVRFCMSFSQLQKHQTSVCLSVIFWCFGTFSLGCCEFGCHRLSGKTRLRNNLLYVECHSALRSHLCQIFSQWEHTWPIQPTSPNWALQLGHIFYVLLCSKCKLFIFLRARP